MSQGEKLIPNFDPQVIKELNLTVLRRIDPFVEEILFIASHVALYVLNVELMQWVYERFRLRPYITATLSPLFLDL